MKKPDKARGPARPAKTTAGKPAAPATGTAALQEALAGLAASPNGKGGHAAGDAQATDPGQAAAAPKTVAQGLGEVAWLMTQSPRHKAMALGDLEWLVMPEILLRQFRIFYQGDRPVGVALWALADDLVA